MRFLICAAASLVWVYASDAPNAALQQIHNVYLLPMGNSLDQYLANRLTEAGLFQVVTDAQKADTIITDKIGEGLERRLAELYPPPKPEKVEKKDENDKTADALAKPPDRIGSFSRGRGTVFVVDRKTHSVLWSVYLPVKSSRPDDTNRRAGEIVKKLRNDLKGKRSASLQP